MMLGLRPTRLNCNVIILDFICDLEVWLYQKDWKLNLNLNPKNDL